MCLQFLLFINGIRDDHVADTIIVYNEEGTEVHLAANWATSHSLTQRCVFDGRYFFTASLGDCFPANIHVVRVDPMFSGSMQLLEKNLKREEIVNTIKYLTEINWIYTILHYIIAPFYNTIFTYCFNK